MKKRNKCLIMVCLKIFLKSSPMVALSCGSFDCYGSVLPPSHHSCSFPVPTIMDAEVFVYMREGGAREFLAMWSAFVSIPPSRRFPLVHLTNARSWPWWSSAKASWKLGMVPLSGAATTNRLRKSSSPTHSGGLTIGHSIILFDVPFVSTMALKA